MSTQDRAAEDDLVFRGFYVTNSEVGKSALKVAVFYLRAICCNRIMWGVEGFEEISIRDGKKSCPCISTGERHSLATGAKPCPL